MNPNVTAWLMSRDTGASSLTIVAWMERSELAMVILRGPRHPLDAADFGRCVRLLDIEPSYRERIGEMAQVSSAWAVLVTHWAELEALYREVAPTVYARKCGDRMQVLLNSVRESEVTRQ